MDSRQSKELLDALNSVNPLTTEPETRFSMVSWNIDGLNPEKIEERTKEVCEILSSEEIDIVFLQDLTGQTIEYIKHQLPQYHVIDGYIKKAKSFTGTLLLRSTVKYESHKIIPYKFSSMKRSLLCIMAGFGKSKLELLNTHLETGRENSQVRSKQLQEAFIYIKSNSLDRTAIFAGDLNLRDKELHPIGGVPAEVDDLWEVCGSSPNSQYTWDTQRNSNAKNMILNVMGCEGFWARMRFDRGYIRYSPERDIVPQHFSLIGKNRIKGTGRRNIFPSDHWGIKAVFDIRREEDSKKQKGKETAGTAASSKLTATQESTRSKQMISGEKKIPIKQKGKEATGTDASSKLTATQESTRSKQMISGEKKIPKNKKGRKLQELMLHPN